MTDAVNKRGIFWWFGGNSGQTDSVGTSVPGLLRITEQGLITLDLEGSLASDEFGGPNWGQRSLHAAMRITGRLDEKDAASSHVLIEGLERTDFSFPDDVPLKHSYTAARCFVEALPFPEEFDSGGCSEMRLDLQGLEEWLELDSIKVQPWGRSGDEVELSVSYKNLSVDYDTSLASIKVESLVLTPVPGFFGDRPSNHISITQDNYLIYSPKEQFGIIDFQKVYTRIEEIISLLLGSYYRFDWPTLVSNDGEFGHWYKFYFYRGSGTSALPSRHSTWSPFSAIRDTFGALIQNWIDKTEQYGAALDLYVNSLQNPLLHPAHRFVNLVWAIESLHRAWQRSSGDSESTKQRKAELQRFLSSLDGNSDKSFLKWLKGKLKYAHEPALETRIFEVIARAPITFDTGQLRKFAERCARRRNDISHEGGCRPGEDVRAFEDEIQKLTIALQYVFHSVLLLEIGVSTEQVAKAMTNSLLAELRVLPALRDAGILNISTEDCPTDF
jgi:hypothetical protein